MAIIKHGSHTIETETIEFILLQPELAIRQQEMKDLVLTIIKAQRIPSRMLPSISLMEILGIGTIKTT